MADIPTVFKKRLKEAQEKNLKSLDLSRFWNGSFYEELSELPGPVFELKQLEELKLNNNTIKVLPPDIKKLSHLELIDLRGNPLKDIPEIKGLFVDFHVFKKCEIKKENIYGLKLKKEDKADLKNFTNLQSLYLSYNKISDISFLKGLSNLQSLDLSSNKISDYSFLKGLSNLQSLYLSYNKISDISFLKGLSNLQSLYLSSNKISDISFLKGLSPAIARFREK